MALPPRYIPGPDFWLAVPNYTSGITKYWPHPIDTRTGNYVTIEVAYYLFATGLPDSAGALVEASALPSSVRVTGDIAGDNLQTMFNQGNHVTQSINADGGYTMRDFPKSQKGTRRGLAGIDRRTFAEYVDVTEDRDVVTMLDAVDLDQQIHSTVGLSAEQFMAVAGVQAVLVPYLTTFEGRTVQKIAQVSLSTFIATITPAILTAITPVIQALIPSPTDPTTPAKTLIDFDIAGVDQIVEGVLDSQYRASVIYSDGSTDFVTTQGAGIDGFSWDIPKATSQGEQIGVTGILPIYANNVVGDGRTFFLELRHASLPGKVARKKITIVDATTAPPPPTTTDPFITLFIDADARLIRIRYRLNDTTRAALVLFRDGNIVYSNDTLPSSYDTSLNQTVLPGTYVARVFEPNRDSNSKTSDEVIVKGQADGASLVTAIDYAHLGKGTDGYPELQLWFKSSVVEDIRFTITTEDQPESQPLGTKSYSDSNGYSRAQQVTNVRGGQLVTVKAWTVSNPGGYVSKSFRVVAGAARNTIFGGTTQPPVETATVIQALDAQWAADGTLTIYGKTSRANGLQFAVANNQGQYSGWFGAASLAGDSAGYQYKGVFSASASGSQALIRFRPTDNNAESAIAYLRLTTPNGAQARATVWANGTQIGGGPVDTQTGLPALQRVVIRGNSPKEPSRCNITLYLDENTGTVYAIDSSNPDKLGRGGNYDWAYFLNDQWLTRDEFHRFPLSRNFPHLVVKVLTDVTQPKVKWRWQNIMAWEETQFLQYR